jgi:hypothetical protein
MGITAVARRVASLHGRIEDPSTRDAAAAGTTSRG